MSIFLRPGQIKVRNDTGEFTSINVMAETSADEIINDIEAAGREVIESIPADYTALTEEVDELNERLLLLDDNVPNTVQTYTFTNGSVSKVEHKNGNTLIRSDIFTYGETTITETRTLNTGAVLTIVTNLTTLEITVTYTAA